MDDHDQVFGPEFFRELRTRMRSVYEWLEQNAFFGILLFVILLILTLIQQVILILIYPLR